MYPSRGPTALALGVLLVVVLARMMLTMSMSLTGWGLTLISREVNGV